MSELRNRMIWDMRLAGLVEGARREYLRAVRQLAAYYMVSPDRLSERNVEDYLLYVRDQLGVANRQDFSHRRRDAKSLVYWTKRLRRGMGNRLMSRRFVQEAFRIGSAMRKALSIVLSATFGVTPASRLN